MRLIAILSILLMTSTAHSDIKYSPEQTGYGICGTTRATNDGDFERMLDEAKDSGVVIIYSDYYLGRMPRLITLAMKRGWQMHGGAFVESTNPSSIFQTMTYKPKVKTKTQYQILCINSEKGEAAQADILSEAVNSFLADGWKLQGGVALAKGETVSLCQAMVRTVVVGRK